MRKDESPRRKMKWLYYPATMTTRIYSWNIGLDRYPEMNTCDICNARYTPPVIKKHLIDLRLGNAHSSFRRSDVIEGCKELLERRECFSEQQIAVVFGRGFTRIDGMVHVLNSASFHVIVFNHLDIACGWLNIDFLQTHHILVGLSRPFRAEYEVPQEHRNLLADQKN